MQKRKHQSDRSSGYVFYRIIKSSLIRTASAFSRGIQMTEPAMKSQSQLIHNLSLDVNIKTRITFTAEHDLIFNAA